MLGLGSTELIIIFVIIVFLFGAKRLPDLATGLGQGIRSFKKAMNEDPAAVKDQQPAARIEESSKTKS